MKQAPNTWKLEDLIDFAHKNKTQIKAEAYSGNIKWISARPLGLHTLKNRIQAAWKVFKGEYDAVKWPGGQ